MYANWVLFVNLAEELTADIVCDNFVIGTLETYDKRKFDIQIYYITDNLNNCYITETELIGEV